MLLAAANLIAGAAVKQVTSLSSQKRLGLLGSVPIQGGLHGTALNMLQTATVARAQ